MILIGLLLILVALAGGAFLFAGTSGLSSQKIDIDLLGVTVSLPPLSLAISGALVVLILWLGWALLRSGTKRSARLRREGKEQARVAKEAQATKERQWAAEREQAQQQQPPAE